MAEIGLSATSYEPGRFPLMAITPPVGVTIFVTKGLSPETPIMSIFKGACYYLVAYGIIIGLLIAFPIIITFAI